MSPCRLHCLACVYEWHFPRGCACSCVSVHVFLCTFLHMCFCVACTHARLCACVCLNKPTSESSIIGPVSAVSLPEGNEVEMRDRKTRGRAACTHACHTPVPNGGRAGHYDVFQMDTSVCFPGNKSAKSRGRVMNKPSLVEFYLFICGLPGCHDVWRENTPPETPLELRQIPQITRVKMSILY